MYDRDKKVENSETLERLLIALERLTELVSKEETSKAILEQFKEKGGKDVQAVPISDLRADDIKLGRPGAGSSRSGSAEDVHGFDVSILRRLNDGFKALQGDLGGFQRVLASSIKWGESGKKIFDQISSVSTPTNLGKGMSLADFTKKYIADMGPGEYMNRVSPDMSWFKKTIEAMEKGGMKVTPGGGIYNEALKNAAKRSEDAFKNETFLKYQDYKRNLPTQQLENVSAGGKDFSQLARVAATVALAAAPIVAGKLIHAGAIGQIEGNRPFSMLSGQLATDYATYDVNRLMSNMRYARGISPTMRNLLQSETEFNKTLEPIRIAGTNATNAFLSGSMDVINTVLKPVSKFAQGVTGNNRNQAIVDEALKGAGWGATIGAGLGGIAAFIASGGNPVAAFWGAAQGAAWGGAGGGVIGGAGEVVGKARMDELDKLIGDGKAHKGMIDVFSMELQSHPICPPRRFVP